MLKPIKLKLIPRYGDAGKKENTTFRKVGNVSNMWFKHKSKDMVLTVTTA